ncbi:MAG: Trk family potassium uptake protein [Oscillibacter sp.]|nr:Trk family potassium uptake protein [Oscillibacter sp.]
MSRRIRLNAVQTLTLSFALLIFAGGLLLTLPFAAQDGHSIPFLDALFTAASASCVTGLSLYDTASQFSPFGQAVILLLIQIGGLGFMTVSILVSLLLRRRVSLHRRAVLMDTVGALQLGGVVRLTRRALLVTGICEGMGALLLTVWFCPRYGLAKGLWMSVFHAISAYCNAGFDLLGTGTSLTTAAGEPLLNMVLMALIICGGLGFLVWDDLLTHGRQFRRWRLHSKIVASFTLAIFVGGAIAFYVLEGNHAFANLPAPQKALMAAFQSVTARTAGFSTVDQAALSQSGTLLMLILMFIGAGSGSTGGGAKVNTFAVLLLSSIARVRRQEDVNAFQRRLDGETIHKAYSSVSLYLMACLAGCMVLCLQGISLDDALFEAVSAIGTVGLSRGVTASLPELSKWAVLLMMFAGRVGSMSVAMAVTRERPQPKRRNVPEKILIG